MKRLLAMLLCLVPASGFAAPVFVTGEHIDYLRANPAAFKTIQRKCDSQLSRVPSPIADFSPPLHYADKQAEAVFSKAISGDGTAAYQHALCYRVTGDTRYALKSAELIDAWASGVQKISQVQGAYNFIFNFYSFIVAADLLRADGGWDDTRFVAFLKDKVLPACEWTLGARNNIGNWAVLHWAASGAYLQDDALLKRARERWEELLNSQVVGDGSLLLEICRTNTLKSCEGPDKGINGLTYTHWTLYPTVLAAEILRNQGMDVYGTSAGEQLNAAYARATAWTLSPTTFPYYMLNKGRLNTYGVIAYMAVMENRHASKDGAMVLARKEVKGDTLELMTLYPRASQK